VFFVIETLCVYSEVGTGFLYRRVTKIVSRDISVGIATRYGLDGPEIESRLGRDFPHLSRPALTPTEPPIQWVPAHCRRYIGRGVALTNHPHLGPRLKKD